MFIAGMISGALIMVLVGIIIEIRRDSVKKYRGAIHRRTLQTFRKENRKF